jgi:putative toxin-antitoxin system antitoxin component (TIGR02293 family)
MSYIRWTNDVKMKKNAKPKKYDTNDEVSHVSEPLAIYRSVKKIPAITEMDFSYRDFEKIADLVPFTQREWASILHLSEKTIQRYAKDNKNFEGIYVDRILQMQELIEAGLKAFTNAEAFYRWLKRDKQVLGHLLNFDSLKSTQGIGLTKDEIERIMYGVYI